MSVSRLLLGLLFTQATMQCHSQFENLSTHNETVRQTANAQTHTPELTKTKSSEEANPDTVDVAIPPWKREQRHAGIATNIYDALDLPTNQDIETPAFKLFDKWPSLTTSIPADNSAVAREPAGADSAELADIAELKLAATDEQGAVQAIFDARLADAEWRQSHHGFIEPVNFQIEYQENFSGPANGPVLQSTAAYAQSGVNSVSQFNVGVDLYTAPDFRNGLLIYGKNVAMKIGGYVKADFIYDFDPIDSTDSFDTTQIPVGALPRTNSRFHARQTRLSFDTRWKNRNQIVKVYVEGDFFSAADTFRLRQAYGESGRLLVGKTWTAFTDVAAAPATLDFEGSVSSVNRRQTQARYRFPICDDTLTGTLSVEDTRFIIDLEPSVGTARSPSPDFVGHIRLSTELLQLQAAALYREIGFQPNEKTTVTRPAGGMNFTGVLMLTGRTKTYSQVLFGKGIGSYRSLPDAAPTNADDEGLLPMFGWMIGLTHEWNDLLSSNFTYAVNSLDNTIGQKPEAIKETTYMAINLLTKPQERITLGIEYLYGTRTNKDLQSADAHRVQAALIFDLP
ncbi:MAG: hypothetical protein OSA98_21820 [Rubripirellula sp.]|nr:hypothetical protein [Rubripirellula sp.]